MPDVLHAMERVWNSCAHPIVPTTHFSRMDVLSQANGFVVSVDGQIHVETANAEDVLPLLEATLYAQIHRWHATAGVVLLHSACVVMDGRAWLMAGESGSGKSTLALHALQLGAAYFSDELTAFDGARVWGIPRALQYNVIAHDGAKLPAHLRKADVDTYRIRTPDLAPADTLARLPIIQPARLARTAIDATHVYVVALSHEPEAPRNSVRPTSTLEALQTLHDACFSAPKRSLGALIHVEQHVALTWSDPVAGIAALRAALAPNQP
jgi:hypothetical protein